MAGLGSAYSAVQDSVGADAPDEIHLDSPAWPAVVAAAARQVQVLVTNDHMALSKLHDAGYRRPLETGQAAPGAAAHQQASSSTA